MEGQGGFLNQILCMKQEIDQLNVRIDAEIRETRRLESELVRCDEEEKEALKQEKGLVQACVGWENDLLDVSARCGALQALNTQVEEDLGKLRRTREALRQRNNEEREAFITHCKRFQQQQAAASPARARLANHVRSLLAEIESRKMLIHHKVEKNSDLQRQINHDRSFNNSLLADINKLERQLSSAEISRQSIEPVDVLEEEKRQLQDCILALKSRLACLQGNASVCTF